jgi:hypothetical protein
MWNPIAKRTIRDVIRYRPETVQIFSWYGLTGDDSKIDPARTVEEVVGEMGLPLDELVADLKAAILVTHHARRSAERRSRRERKVRHLLGDPFWIVMKQASDWMDGGASCPGKLKR